MSVDQELWLAFCKKDKSALEQLYKLWYPDLFRFGFNYSKDEFLIEDEIHNTFLKLWNKEWTDVLINSPKGFVIKSFRNELINTLKSQNRFLKSDIDFDDAHMEYAFSVEELLIKEEIEEEEIQRIRDAINQLPNRQKEVIYLRFYLAMSLEEISEIMHLTYQSVRNLLQKAYLKLRGYLNGITFATIIFLGFSFN